MDTQVVPRYGVNTQSRSENAVDQAVESIKLLGYAVVDGGYDAAQIGRFESAFDRALKLTHDRHGGRENLAKIDEHNTVRALLGTDRLFLDLALNPAVTAVARRLVGDYIVLNQQNGIVNPPNRQHYNQAAFHRDLPYQHFVSSHPLAINALFCIDPFTVENGATYVVPASHKMEAFPSDGLVRGTQLQVSAKAGSFIILDCMLFHSGGINRTSAARRAVNHLYTVPFIRQQIDLPVMLGPDYAQEPDVRRFLGYDVQTAPSVDAFYQSRWRKIEQPGQAAT